LGEEVFFGGEVVGGEDGGIEVGLGVFEGVFAGEFEGPIDGAESAGGEFEGLGADSPEFDCGGGYGFDLLVGWGLGPREGVEDGIGSVAEPLGQL